MTTTIPKMLKEHIKCIKEKKIIIKKYFEDIYNVTNWDLLQFHFLQVFLGLILALLLFFLFCHHQMCLPLRLSKMSAESHYTDADEVKCLAWTVQWSFKLKTNERSVSQTRDPDILVLLLVNSLLCLSWLDPVFACNRLHPSKVQ